MLLEFGAVIILAASAGMGGWMLATRFNRRQVKALEDQLVGSAIAETRRYMMSLLWWVTRRKDLQPAGAQPDRRNYPLSDAALVGDMDVLNGYLNALARIAATPHGQRLPAEEWHQVRSVSRTLDAALTEQEALLSTGRRLNTIATLDATNFSAQLDVVVREASGDSRQVLSAA